MRVGGLQDEAEVEEEAAAVAAGYTIAGPLAPGKAGRRVQLGTNLYDLRLGGDGTYYRYSVELTRISKATGRPFDMGKGAGNE